MPLRNTAMISALSTAREGNVHIIRWKPLLPGQRAAAARTSPQVQPT